MIVRPPTWSNRKLLLTGHFKSHSFPFGSIRVIRLLGASERIIGNCSCHGAAFAALTLRHCTSDTRSSSAAAVTAGRPSLAMATPLSINKSRVWSNRWHATNPLAPSSHSHLPFRRLPPAASVHRRGDRSKCRRFCECTGHDGAFASRRRTTRVLMLPLGVDTNRRHACSLVLVDTLHGLHVVVAIYRLVILVPFHRFTGQTDRCGGGGSRTRFGEDAMRWIGVALVFSAVIRSKLARYTAQLSPSFVEDTSENRIDGKETRLRQRNLTALLCGL